MEYVRNVLIAGIVKYERKLKKSMLPPNHSEYKPLHLGTHYNTLGRWKGKVMGVDSWFEDKNEEEKDVPVLTEESRKKKRISFPKAGIRKVKVKTSTVMFIPSSKGGLLAKMMKDNEDGLAEMTRFRVKIQEAGGTKLARMFSTDLGAGEPCGRENCQPCNSRTGCRPKCKKQSILYESKCKECNPGEESSHQEGNQPIGRIGIYVGETSRSLFERTKEHFGDADGFKPGSHMVKHWMTSHSESNACPSFEFNIIGSYTDCLSRQVAEALRIMNSKDVLLNSKNEYASNCLSRVCVDMDKYERRKQERREEEQEKADLRKLEEFKAKHMRPKRKTIPEEEGITAKRRKVNLSGGVATRIAVPSPSPGDSLGGRGARHPNNKPNTWSPEEVGRDDNDLELGLWLRLGEERCLRVGNLKSRLAEDKQRVLSRMEEWNKRYGCKETRMVESMTGGQVNLSMGVATRIAEPSPRPGDLLGGRGARHPVNKPTTRRCLVGDYVLTSYSAWWRRIEKIESQFWKEVEKDENRRRQKKEELRKKQEEKKMFVKKFFPRCDNSPGGTLRLRGGDRNTNSTEGVAMGKILSEESCTTSNLLRFNLQEGEKKSGSGRGHPRSQLSDLFGGNQVDRDKETDMEKDKFSANRNYLG